MTRTLAVPSLLFALAACGAKTNPSICDVASLTTNPVCQMTCDATPGAAASCPGGFHCSPDGMCDAQCDGQHPCGDGYSCTADGYCMSNGSNDPGGPDANCPAISFTPMPVTPSIGLVLDRSGSMAGTDVTPTRYQAMVDALVGVPNGVVTTLESKAYFGSELYTCATQSGTQVDLINVPRALNNAGMIRTSLTGTGPGNGTPTPEAINAEVASFAASPPPAGSPPIIVLATDGAPNSCGGSNDTRTQSEAAAAASFNAGIPLYVLAINAGNAQHFQNLANAGQTGSITSNPPIKYYPVTNATDLKAAFDTIISGVISCDLTLTSSLDPQAAMDGTVTVNGTMLMYGTDWTLVNGNIVRLTGAACAMLKSTTNPQVSATFPCGSVLF